MDSRDLRKLFTRKLGFWSLHCVISALPGFLCAILVLGELGQWKLAHVFPMAAAVITFVIGLAAFFTWLESKGPINGLVQKGMTLGLRIRIVMVVAGLLILAASQSGSYEGVFFIPDLWIGLLAIFVNLWIFEALGNTGGFGNMWNDAAGPGFGVIYAISLTVGVIIALLIFILSFISTLFFQMRKRREIITRQGLPRADVRIH